MVSRNSLRIASTLSHDLRVGPSAIWMSSTLSLGLSSNSCLIRVVDRLHPGCMPPVLIANPIPYPPPPTALHGPLPGRGPRRPVM